jgi:hypothetical protein
MALYRRLPQRFKLQCSKSKAEIKALTQVLAVMPVQQMMSQMSISKK